MNSKSFSKIALFSLVFASAAACAQSQPRPSALADVTMAMVKPSTVTRAEVVAEMNRARAAGEMDYRLVDYPLVVVGHAKAPRTAAASDKPALAQAR
jgi:hypothetical protein